MNNNHSLINHNLELLLIQQNKGACPSLLYMELVTQNVVVLWFQALKEYVLGLLRHAQYHVSLS